MADTQSFGPRLPSFYESAIRSDSVADVAEPFLSHESLELLFEREATKTDPLERFPSSLNTESKDESQIPALNDQSPDPPPLRRKTSQTAKLSVSPVQLNNQVQDQAQKEERLPEASAATTKSERVPIFNRPKIAAQTEVNERTVPTDARTLPAEYGEPKPAPSLQSRVEPTRQPPPPSARRLLEPLFETRAQATTRLPSPTPNGHGDLKSVSREKERQVEARVLETSSPLTSRAIADSLETEEVSFRASAVLANSKNETSPLPVVRPRVDPDRHTQGWQIKPPPMTEQIVNVTIGRLEIRAAPASGVTKRLSTQNKPPTSLEEYLRPQSNRDKGVSA